MLRNSRWAGLFLLLVPVLAFGVACGEAEVEVTPSLSGGPRVAFEKEEVDLGRVPLDKVVRHEFRFHNVGNAPLTVGQVTIQVLEGC